MRIAQIIGNVTLSKQHPLLEGARLRLAIPLSQSELESPATPQGDSVVVWDDLGAGVGGRIAMSEGAEAAQPFRPHLKPIDAYCAGILDDVHL
ncbi:MAG: EutN/CcmL family microcompartment protein [Planctomycetota bacterium]